MRDLLVWPCLLAYLFRPSSAGGCRSGRETREPKNVLPTPQELVMLDRLHLSQLRSRLLGGLGFRSIPPRNASFSLPTRRSAPALQPSFTLRLSPSPSGLFRTRFTGGDAVTSAVLVLPGELWESRLHLRHGRSRLSLHDDLDWLEDGEDVRVNLTALLSGAKSIQFSLQVDPEDPSLLAETRLEVVVRESVEKRSRRALSDLIIDCEAQWDAAHFNDTPADIQDNLLPCCRRKLVVDFAELEWEHWVIAPYSFETHYCLGRCGEFGGLGPETGEGAAVYADLMRRKGAGLGLSPCCAPTAFAPLTVTVLLNPSEEVTKTLSELLVTSCGCL